MYKYRLLALACGVTLAIAPAASAQQKSPPNNPPVQGKDSPKVKQTPAKSSNGADAYRFVAGDEVLHHGDQVSIKRKVGDEKVAGTFVWADQKTGRLYIRPKAGQAPIGVSARDIDRIDRIKPAVGTANKGGIKPAIEPNEPAAPSYEIQTMTVHNGPYTSVFYYDSSLSPAEREQLRELEKASNDVAQKGRALESLKESIPDSRTTSGTTIMAATNGPMFVYPYYFQYYELPYWLHYGYYPDFYGYPIGAPYYFGGGGSSVVVQNLNPGDMAKAQEAYQKSVRDAEAALNAAQKRYADVRTHGVYDRSGRIIAVRHEE